MFFGGRKWYIVKFKILYVSVDLTLPIPKSTQLLIACFGVGWWWGGGTILSFHSRMYTNKEGWDMCPFRPYSKGFRYADANASTGTTYII